MRIFGIEIGMSKERFERMFKEQVDGTKFKDMLVLYDNGNGAYSVRTAYAVRTTDYPDTARIQDATSWDRQTKLSSYFHNCAKPNGEFMDSYSGIRTKADVYSFVEFATRKARYITDLAKLVDRYAPFFNAGIRCSFYPMGDNMTFSITINEVQKFVDVACDVVSAESSIYAELFNKDAYKSHLITEFAKRCNQVVDNFVDVTGDYPTLHIVYESWSDPFEWITRRERLFAATVQQEADDRRLNGLITEIKKRSKFNSKKHDHT